MQPRSAWHATPLKHHAGKACMSAVDAAKAPSLNWAAIDADPRFQCLHSEKTRLLAGLMLFSILQDFALPIVAACLPEIFRVKVWGRMNVGILFALSKFILAWAQTTVRSVPIGACRKSTPSKPGVRSNSLKWLQRSAGSGSANDPAPGFPPCDAAGPDRSDPSGGASPSSSARSPPGAYEHG